MATLPTNALTALTILVAASSSAAITAMPVDAYAAAAHERYQPMSARPTLVRMSSDGRTIRVESTQASTTEAAWTVQSYVRTRRLGEAPTDYLNVENSKIRTFSAMVDHDAATLDLFGPWASATLSSDFNFSIPEQSGLQSSASAAVFEALDRLADLETNWNLRGGIAPTQSTIDGAKALYGRLVGRASTPVVEASGDGEINFVWRSAEGAYLEVGLTDEGQASFYGDLLGSEVLGDIDLVSPSLPDALRIALDAFANGGV